MSNVSEMRDAGDAGGHPLPSLRSLFVAGERGDPETVQHFQKALGVDVVDNWWQTETGFPISGFQRTDIGTKPGSCGMPLPGYRLSLEKSPDADDDDFDNKHDHGAIALATGGENGVVSLGQVALELPLPPGHMQRLYSSLGARAGKQATIDKYLSDYPGRYSCGDSGVVDGDGYLSILCRTDDVINTAGHRLSTGAIEEVISRHRAVAEVAVVGVADKLKGQLPVALVVRKEGTLLERGRGASPSHSQLEKELVDAVRRDIGPVCAFRRAIVVAALPKTRSGKILRKTIRQIADQDQDYTVPATIDDPSTIALVQKALESANLQN